MDPTEPIHLRTYFNAGPDAPIAEILLGAPDPENCYVIARVYRNQKPRIEASRFKQMHVRILDSIMAAMDVHPDDRQDVLGWMNSKCRTEADEKGWCKGNVEQVTPVISGWPYDLTDNELVDAANERDGCIPRPRWQALMREAGRRRIGHLIRPQRRDLRQ